MPQSDKTGPEGKGPKTGRGLGECNKTKNVETKTNWPNWFLGRGPGRRRRNWNRAPLAENE